MKIPNEQKLQQIEFNHLSDFKYKEFMYLYKKWIEKPNSFFI